MTAVKNWMDHCFRNIDRLNIESFSAYSDFWEELPGMVEHVLRREYVCLSGAVVPAPSPLVTGKILTLTAVDYYLLMMAKACGYALKSSSWTMPRSQ